MMDFIQYLLKVCPFAMEFHCNTYTYLVFPQICDYIFLKNNKLGIKLKNFIFDVYEKQLDENKPITSLNCIFTYS